MMAMPWRRSRSMMSNSRSVSRVVSDVVGSSKMIMRALLPSALAISTSCRSPCDRRLTGVFGCTSRSTADNSSCVRVRTFVRSMNGSPGTRLGKPAMNRFSATVRLRNRLSSWWMNAMPRASASRGPRGRYSVPSNVIRPASIGSTPPRMFIVVDLPEPFSPTSPSTCPARTEKPMSCSTCTPKKLLLRPCALKNGDASPGLLMRAGSAGGAARRARLPAGSRRP